MKFLILFVIVTAAPAEVLILEERIDLFDPSTGAYLGAERVAFGTEGRRLRWENTAASGEYTLQFFVSHDALGREAQAVYFESDPWEPYREVFTYSEDGRLRTTTYYYEPDTPADRAESDLDAVGREVFKRYYRADGSQYGEEEVLWDGRGNKLGWDFRFVGKDGGASFRYSYEAFDGAGEWTRRLRSRDGKPERVEVRTLVRASEQASLPTAAPFAAGIISTEASESSPSFADDGKTMVFAHYHDDWTRKSPFIAYAEDNGWRVEPLEELGAVYNLAISPDASTLVYATKIDDKTKLYRVQRRGTGWSDPHDLTEQYGLRGTYPCLTSDGDLLFFDSDGSEGPGIYLASRDRDGFGAAVPLFIPDRGTAFDAFATDADGPVFLAWCRDEVCESGPENGIWKLRGRAPRATPERKLPALPYAWGVQPVESLGLFVFTDGEDILALPLTVAVPPGD